MASTSNSRSSSGSGGSTGTCEHCGSVLILAGSNIDIPANLVSNFGITNLELNVFTLVIILVESLALSIPDLLLKRWLGTISIDAEGNGEGNGEGGGDKVGGVGGNLVASTQVSSVLTNACSDPQTAVDYCLRFYLSRPLTCYGSPLDVSVTSDTAPPPSTGGGSFDSCLSSPWVVTICMLLELGPPCGGAWTSMHMARSSMSMVSMEVALRPCLLPVPARPLASCLTIPRPAMVVFFRALVPVLLPYEPTASMLPVYSGL
ncbi:uncharacterized protein UDID_17910 [Ustilago sp. UG-2017a]|nr:uncharacterized protein UDID_17910 [Ustilago sp. UG-2017a]